VLRLELEVKRQKRVKFALKKNIENISHIFGRFSQIKYVLSRLCAYYGRSRASTSCMFPSPSERSAVATTSAADKFCVRFEDNTDATLDIRKIANGILTCPPTLFLHMSVVHAKYHGQHHCSVFLYRSTLWSLDNLQFFIYNTYYNDIFYRDFALARS
jgi:hypothetical protein